MSLYIKALQRLLAREAGMAFSADKLFLAESRLQPVAERAGFQDVFTLVAEIQRGGDAALTRAAVEAMTTHETLFFRDRTVFEQLRTVMLPKLMAMPNERKRLRIWCAAVSTGQEAYSLAMLLDDEAKRLEGWKVDILATDLSHAVIDVARRGVYSHFEVQRGLPIASLMRYFKRGEKGWQIAENMRSRIAFKPQNLVEDFSQLGQFDIIFCRNVLIYMDGSIREQILHRLASMLTPRGYLVLGSTESTGHLAPGLSALQDCSCISVKALPILRGLLQSTKAMVAAC